MLSDYVELGTEALMLVISLFTTHLRTGICIYIVGGKNVNKKRLHLLTTKSSLGNLVFAKEHLL